MRGVCTSTGGTIASAPANVAGKVLRQLEATVQTVKDAGAETRPRVAAGWKDLDKAYNQHREFNVAAFEMISSPRWNVSASVTMPYDADHAAGPSGQPQ